MTCQCDCGEAISNLKRQISKLKDYVIDLYEGHTDLREGLEELTGAVYLRPRQKQRKKHTPKRNKGAVKIIQLDQVRRMKSTPTT